MKQNILKVIGDTPLVNLNRLVNEDSTEIYAKLEVQITGKWGWKQN